MEYLGACVSVLSRDGAALASFDSILSDPRIIGSELPSPNALWGFPFLQPSLAAAVTNLYVPSSFLLSV